MKTSRLFSAFVAAAFLCGGAAACVIASAFRVAPQFPPVGEDQSGGVAETFGDPILALSRPRGHALVSLHDEALRPRAMFSLDPGGNPEIAIFDDRGVARATLGLMLLKEEEVASLSFGPNKSLMLFTVPPGEAGGMAALARGEGGMLTMGVRGQGETHLLLRGSEKKSALRADFAEDGTPRITFADRGGNERLALAPSDAARKDRP